MRGLLRALALAGVLAAAGPAAAVGTILVPGASLRTGSAPSPGRVLLDPAAGPGTPPAAPLPDSLGSLGTPPGPPPAFPGAATGSGGNFAATSPTSLPGGTYDFASFNVGPGGTVEFTGPVVLDVAGNVNVAGSVTTAGPGRSLEIRCGGAFTVFGGDALTTARGVFTTGSASPITVDAAGGFVLGDPLAPTTRASIAAASGAVTVTGHGAAAAFEVGNGVVEASSGALVLRSAGAARITGPGSRVAGTAAGNAEVRVQALGGDLLVDGGALVQAAGFSGPLLVEAAGSVTVSGAALLRASGGPRLLATAFGGDLVLDSGFAAGLGSSFVSLHAAGGLTLRNGAGVSAEFGLLDALAFGGDLVLREPGLPEVDVGTGSGAIRLGASRDVLLRAGAAVHSTGGRIEVDAFRDLLLEGDGPLALSSAGSAVEVVAARGILVAPPGPLSDRALEGTSVAVLSGTGGADLADLRLRAGAGDLAVRAAGAVAFHGTASARGSLALEAAGALDVSGAALSTDPVSGGPSGDVLLRCHLLDGTLDATGADVASGSSSTASGDVRLLVRGDPVSLLTESFVLPRNLEARRDAADPSSSELVAAGWLDTGPDAVDLSAPATVTAGALAFDVPGLAPNGAGNLFKYRGAGLVLSIAASRAGSSRAKFRLRARGDFATEAGLEQEITLSFDNGTMAGRGTVDLDAGRYTLGRRRGALVAPDLYLAKAKAVLQGAGRDSFQVVCGLATDGTTPAQAPDVTVSFGGGFTETVSGADFVPQGEKYVYRAKTGVTLLVLDYPEEKVTVKGKAVTLGTFPEGPSAVPISLRLGAEVRTVRVRMGKSGTALRY